MSIAPAAARPHRDAARRPAPRRAASPRWSARWSSSAPSAIWPGRYLAPFERITWSLALDADERREYDALRDVYRRAWRAFQGNHLGASWEDFLRHAARTDEGRRGIAAWRRARRLLAFPRRKREALALLLARHRAQRTLIFVADNETAYRIAREQLVMPLTCDIGRTERDAVLGAVSRRRRCGRWCRRRC